MFHGNEVGIVPTFPTNLRCDKFGNFQHRFFNITSYYLNFLAILRFSDSPWDLEAKSWDSELILTMPKPWVSRGNRESWQVCHEMCVSVERCHCDGQTEQVSKELWFISAVSQTETNFITSSHFSSFYENIFRSFWVDLILMDFLFRSTDRRTPLEHLQSKLVKYLLENNSDIDAALDTLVLESQSVSV